MKRDIDLCRQLLFEIESEGADCAITRLRKGVAVDTVNGEPTDRIRYHLRLLIDGGLVKEIDRTSAGVPCVRLTNAGHELLELSRSDVRWRDAKHYTRETTGGYSLTVLRAVLTKWAVEGLSGAAYGRRVRAPRRVYRPYYHRVEPRRYYYDYRDREPLTEDTDDLQLVRTRPDYRERYDVLDGYDRDYVVSDRVVGDRVVADRAPVDRYDYVADSGEGDLGVSLPVYLV